MVTHAPGALPPFFSGLLPEGRRLVALRTATKTSADDELTLLLAVGGDAVGDVQVVAEAGAGVDVEPRLSVSGWGDVRFADLLSASVGGAASFDRVPKPEGGTAMLAQEDGCQVLARYPADKCRLTTEAVIGGLADVCRARPVAAPALLKQFAFAYLICNGDAHAKNFSVLRTSGEWRVAPAYDVPTSYVYGDHTLALSLNGKRREDVDRKDFLALGENIGVRGPAVERALDELLERAELWINELGSLPFDEGILRKLRRAIDYRRDRLAG